VSSENALPSVKRLVDFNASASGAATTSSGTNIGFNDEQLAMLDAICNEQKMTQVIRASESVPLLIHWLICRFDEQSRMDWAGDL
jgi:hypothetical protein